MKAHDNGSCFSCTATKADIQDFADSWPCSGMRNPRKTLWVQWDKDGNLIDMRGDSEDYDGGALVALTADMRVYAEKRLKRKTLQTEVYGNRSQA